MLGASFLQLLGKAHQHFGWLVLKVVGGVIQELQQLFLVVHVILQPLRLAVAVGGFQLDWGDSGLYLW